MPGLSALTMLVIHTLLATGIGTLLNHFFGTPIVNSVLVYYVMLLYVRYDQYFTLIQNMNELTLALNKEIKKQTTEANNESTK